MSTVEFTVDWKPGRDVRFPEEATVAELEFRLGDEAITRHKALGSAAAPVSDTVYGPVAGIVDWLIENWASLFWETQTPFRKIREAGQEAVFPGVRESL